MVYSLRQQVLTEINPVMLTRMRVALQSRDALRRTVDFLIAAILFRLPPSLRSALFRGERHECPLCGAHLSRFLVLHRPFFRWCPVCHSLQRHRVSWLFIRQHILSVHPIRRMLHIAPEEALRLAFQRLPDIEYVSMDLYAADVLVRADVGWLPFASHTFDFIYCSHVLEHIPDDRAAMRELQRVLRPGGVALVLVPVWDKPTFEDPVVTDPVERERLFGQFDHVRWYGFDIVDRLTDSGFAVQVIRAGDVADVRAINRFGLDQADVLFGCTKPAR